MAEVRCSGRSGGGGGGGGGGAKVGGVSILAEDSRPSSSRTEEVLGLEEVSLEDWIAADAAVE